jgi:hypothetical protein
LVCFICSNQRYFKKKEYMKKILLICIIFLNNNILKSEEMRAYDLFKGCQNYYHWVENNYKGQIDEKMLFDMGKCQGVVETMGKTMLTLCYENKRNMNVNKKMTANLKGVKTIEIVKRFVKTASLDGNIRNFSAQIYLINFINKNWPCD